MKPIRRTYSVGSPCGLFRRLMIMLYDAVVIVALLMAAAAVPMLFGMANYTAAKDPAYTLYLITVWFLYLGWCWRKGGMTLGMRAWRVCIENELGNRPSWKQCLVRFLASLLSAFLAGLGFAWSLFDSDRRTWHDVMSRTRLLRC